MTENVGAMLSLLAISFGILHPIYQTARQLVTKSWYRVHEDETDFTSGGRGIQDAVQLPTVNTNYIG